MTFRITNFWYFFVSSSDICIYQIKFTFSRYRRAARPDLISATVSSDKRFFMEKEINVKVNKALLLRGAVIESEKHCQRHNGPEG